MNVMENVINFDELAGKAFARSAGESDFENLFAAVFSLPAWYFIADAEFQYKMPYCVPFKIFDDAITLPVFTGGERARKFIMEGNLKGGAAVANVAPEDLVMKISTDGILDFFDRLAPFNITKIFFNPDKDSYGFHHDLKMMRPIYEHLKNKNLLTKTETATNETAENNLAKLIEENADVIAEFERENEMLSSIIAGSAAAMEGVSEEDKERIISNTADMFESVRVEQNMSPKLFRAYIETCLEKQKFLLPTLAFAYFQQTESGIKKLEQDKELSDDLAKWFIKKAVPGADLLMDETPQNSPANIEEKSSENDFQANESSEKKSAESGVDFDELSRRTHRANPPMEDLNALFGAVFALSEWLFISRGELPNVNPYVASNAEVAGGQQMVRAFTDSNRLQRFARENNLTDAEGNALMLTIPTKGVVEYLEQFIEYGVHGVWFNSDTGSEGFFVPLKQLRPIREHLAKLNQPENGAKNSKKKTLLLLIQDGLGFPSGFVSEASYKLNVFCRVPQSWTDGDILKPEAREKIFEFLYGANWRMGNDDGSRYVVIDSFSKVFDEETVKNTRWEATENTDKDHYRFYLVGEDGAISSVKAEEFQSDIDAELKMGAASEARANQDRLAGLGMSQNADGSFDQNLSINQVGTVNFDTSIAPFYEAVVPLLKDFQGTGEYLTLLRFEPEGMSQLVENITENAHGAYLQIRRFLYLNPKNGVRIGVNSIHSNHLRHVQTNAELIVSIELCKNLDNQTGVFYHAFQGPRADVLRLQAAIQPLLESCNYQAVR